MAALGGAAGLDGLGGLRSQPEPGSAESGTARLGLNSVRCPGAAAVRGCAAVLVLLNVPLGPAEPAGTGAHSGAAHPASRWFSSSSVPHCMLSALDYIFPLPTFAGGFFPCPVLHTVLLCLSVF